MVLMGIAEFDDEVIGVEASACVCQRMYGSKLK
jgi:hypothetical protein